VDSGVKWGKVTESERKSNSWSNSWSNPRTFASPYISWFGCCRRSITLWYRCPHECMSGRGQRSVMGHVKVAHESTESSCQNAGRKKVFRSSSTRQHARPEERRRETRPQITRVASGVSTFGHIIRQNPTFLGTFLDSTSPSKSDIPWTLLDSLGLPWTSPQNTSKPATGQRGIFTRADLREKCLYTRAEGQTSTRKDDGCVNLTLHSGSP